MPSKHIGDANFAIPLPTSESSGIFSFTSDNDSVATIKGDSIIIKGVGTANITATQSATTKYTTASIVATFNVLSNVYITGYATAGSIVASYWKNGARTDLPNQGFPTDIVINNKDIYVTGSITQNNNNGSPGYWKNGKPVYLSGREGQASAMAIVGNDIYVAGYIESNDDVNDVIATLWKNGVIIPLQDAGVCCRPGTSSEAMGIAVQNGQVYLSGITTLVNNATAATVWKTDGTATTLSTPYVNAFLDTISFAYGIRSFGNDLYIPGYITTKNGRFLTYWKNNIPVSLTTTAIGQSSGFNSIAVSGTDVYTAGVNNESAAYWKNGVETILSTNAEANGIAVDGNNIYVIGDSFASVTIATPVFWLNGVIQPLQSLNNTTLTAIELVTH